MASLEQATATLGHRPRYNMVLLWAVCLVAAMGGFLFGYDWVVIGGAKPFYEPYFAIPPKTFWQGWAQSSALVGCLMGAAISGALSDRLGRRRLLITAGFLFTLSAIWTAIAWDYTSFNLARITGGIGIGLASNLSPMYIAEIAPAEIRGVFVSINQLTIVIGILAAQITNLLIAQPVPQDIPADQITAFIRESWNGQFGWRWMFGAETFPAVGFFLLMFFVPESPRWLVKSGYDTLAERILARVGGPDYARHAVADIRQTLSAEAIARVRLGDLLERRLLRVVALGVFLAVFQQWCGINVIFNYAQEVFQAAGYAVSDVLVNIVFTGIVNLVFTFVAIFTVDRWGRRFLMLFGAGGLALIFGLLGLGYYFHSTGWHMLVLVLAAIGCYAMSLAPITWVVISEIFPNRIRGLAMSVAVLSLWAACTALTLTFPILNRNLGPHGTFWLYAGVCAVGFLTILATLPETKGKTLEEIERELVR
ncbi:MAG TPA: sugar porter family MFS transporter [Thermogutta sp.]|nr:sugar porter family MFS transporter [Thermogutta sp.]